MYRPITANKGSCILSHRFAKGQVKKVKPKADAPHA